MNDNKWAIAISHLLASSTDSLMVNGTVFGRPLSQASNALMYFYKEVLGH